MYQMLALRKFLLPVPILQRLPMKISQVSNGNGIKSLGSSSSGNCYILDNGNEALIIEAGIRFIDVKRLWISIFAKS